SRRPWLRRRLRRGESGAIPPSSPASARSRRSEAETEARREGGRPRSHEPTTPGCTELGGRIVLILDRPVSANYTPAAVCWFPSSSFVPPQPLWFTKWSVEVP